MRLSVGASLLWACTHSMNDSSSKVSPAFVTSMQMGSWLQQHGHVRALMSTRPVQALETSEDRYRRQRNILYTQVTVYPTLYTGTTQPSMQPPCNSVISEPSLALAPAQSKIHLAHTQVYNLGPPGLPGITAAGARNHLSALRQGQPLAVTRLPPLPGSLRCVRPCTLYTKATVADQLGRWCQLGNLIRQGWHGPLSALLSVTGAAPADRQTWALIAGPPGHLQRAWQTITGPCWHRRWPLRWRQGRTHPARLSHASPG